MKINDLRNGQTVVARWGRYVATKDEPDWCPWKNVSLYVQRDAKGQIVMIALQGEEWAEYDPRHDYYEAHPSGFPPSPAGLLCEDYYLEIEGLE